ncbi:hypothetical protein B0H13DRAFT_1869333 [Mycena leptocephala]|nr:hypothetical protein B0H13DRAFT_1869333 [Mycena leptocephala]
MAIVTNNKIHITQLIRAGLNNGESIAAMMEWFYWACVDVHYEGPKYNPKGFTADDYMVGLCVLRLGGACLADLLHRALGLPGLTIAEIEANIDTYTTGEETPTGTPKIVHQVLMLDEIAMEKQHSQNVGQQFCDLDDVTAFFASLDRDEFHLASEATIAALGSLACTCKTEKGAEHATLLCKLLEVANNWKEHGNIIYRTVSVASDGKAKVLRLPLSL